MTTTKTTKTTKTTETARTAKTILIIAGARPNFMKIAPLLEALRGRPGVRPVLVHTGQHYDDAMSNLFFRDLGIPAPDVNLEVGSGSHAAQTAAIMTRFEPVVLQERPDLVVVVGDVNSTIACALTAVKLGVPVAHVEAGLRSFDRSMPEEINRVLTDAISEHHFVTEESAVENLAREGIDAGRVHFVGNLMIDTLLRNRERALGSTILADLALEEGCYGLVTLHRPSNVDAREVFDGIFGALERIAEELPLVFPCHPRTRARIREFGLEERCCGGGASGIRLLEPLGYLDFLRLMSGARLVLSDSGGIQEETTILGVPCITLRENTERPVTISEGTNTLVGTDPARIARACRDVLSGRCAGGERRPRLWDGKAAERIAGVILETCLSKA